MKDHVRRMVLEEKKRWLKERLHALQVISAHQAGLTRTQRWSIHWCARINDWTEAQWLTANNWKQVEPGWWSLPHWHPRRSQPLPKEVRGETKIVGNTVLYGQKHAANSQRFYNRIEQPARIPRPRVDVLPTYLRFQPWILLLVTCTNLCGISAVILYEHWYSTLLFSTAIIFGFITAYMVYTTRKGCELDYAEQKLGGKDEIYYPTQAGSRR